MHKAQVSQAGDDPQQHTLAIACWTNRVGAHQRRVQRGDIDRAKAVFEPLRAKLQHASPALLGEPLALLGYESEARALVKEVSRDADVDPAFIFLTHYRLKAYDDALVWLRRGIDDRGLILNYVRMPDAFPGLQELPGYAEILRHLDSLQRSR